MKSLRLFVSILLALHCWKALGVIHSGKDNPSIEFTTTKQPLIWHILDCMNKPTYAFSTTYVVRMENGKFIQQGNIFSLSKSDLEEYIQKNNWIYTSDYTKEKTGLNNDRYEYVGAILLGTTDEKELEKLICAKIRHMQNSIPK